MKRTPCKTPNKRTPFKSQQSDVKHQIKVFCRVRPLQNETDGSYIKVLSNKTISITPPCTVNDFQSGKYKSIHYSFNSVFHKNDGQETVFEEVALPLVNKLIKGENCLLFAYGVSGSGKTYTMTGRSKNSGIIPRTLDVIFSSITELQTEKFVFKPDKMNGFEIQSDEDALKERKLELEAYLKYARATKVTSREYSDEFGEKTAQTVQPENVNEDNTYAVFVSYVEIYNNGVYDLLEENLESKSRQLQAKIVREDSARNMYVHGVVEVEVKSSKEACDLLSKGMRKKHIAFTNLNSDSSRSHSIFTIRLVQTPLNSYGDAPVKVKEAIHISQLCLVDLAGSERTSRTKNSGNINNSLMTLKTCLEILRENQTSRTKKLVPYRDSKLTYLFKNYFERDSHIHTLICVNTRTEDFDETVQVMKFADVTKEVVVQQNTVNYDDVKLPAGRRQANKLFQKFQNEVQHLAEQNTCVTGNLLEASGCNFNSNSFPALKMKDPNHDKLVVELVDFLKQRNHNHNIAKEQIEEKVQICRDELRTTLMEYAFVKEELKALQNTLDHEQKRRIALENKLHEMNARAFQLQLESEEKDQTTVQLQKKIEEKDMQLKQEILDTERIKQKYCDKLINERKKGAHEMHSELFKQEVLFQKLQEKKVESLSKLKHILDGNGDAVSTSSSDSIPPLELHGPSSKIEGSELRTQSRASLTQALTTIHSAQAIAQALSAVLSPPSSG